MSRYLRPNVTGARVFFTVNLARRGSNLLVREIDGLREAVRVTRAERPFEILSWVVLPDHMHAIWQMPVGDQDYGTRWGAIKARFVMHCRRAGFSPPSEMPVVRSGRFAGLKPGLRKNKREAPIWQRRFYEHHIRDEAEYVAHLRYCWFNPEEHGLVERPEDWPYSLVHRDVGVFEG